MSSLRPNKPNDTPPGRSEPERLPLRWAVIGLVAAIAGAAALPVGGVGAAVGAAVVVATGLHSLLA